jgi:hypothetical protein
VAPNSTLRRLLGTWRAWTPRERRRALLASVMLLAFAMQVPVWLWNVDDAAIGFAYARNLADGEGLVAQPGGERVEGYSDPLWVLLLSLWEVVGIDGFVSSKIMGLLFGVATVSLVWAIARWSRPDRDEVVPLLAACALAANAQFAIWNTSGLENSLFNLLLAAGVWRTLVETRTRGLPWSALLFLGVSLTRPEGILYAAAGGFAAMVFALRDGRGLRPALRWLVVFFLPFGLYQALRIRYFAWPFPNTYYAKLADALGSPLDWNGRGWSYVRSYAGLSLAERSPGPGLGQGYLLPIYLFGALGTASRRGWIALALACAAGALLLFPAPPELAWWPALDPGQWLAHLGLIADARGWLAVRVVLLLVLAIAVPLLAAGRTGGRALALCWALAAISVFFAVRSRGDWMNGYRWLSLLCVPASVLFAAGVGELREWVGRRFPPRDRRARLAGAAVAAALTALFVVPQLRHLFWFNQHPPISAYSVKRRVAYQDQLMDTLHLERAVLLDVDMGAHLFWSRAELVDMAGLIDVPIAHHHFDEAFVREYIFRERRPDLAHVHGGWAAKSHIPDFPEWSAEYVALPGYLSGTRAVHTGDHVRRDLLVRPGWEGASGRRVAFRNGATLAGWELPGLPAAPGLDLAVSLGLEQRPPAGGTPASAYQLEIFLADANGVVARRIVAPGYGWLPPSEWREGEVFHGYFTLPLGTDVPPGAYDLGFLLRDTRDRVIPANAPPPPAARRPRDPVVGGERGVPARVQAGEVRFPRAVAVVSLERAMDRNRANFAMLEKRAAKLDCDRAEAAWRRIRERMAQHTSQLDLAAPVARRGLAECWARRALASQDREEQIAWLARARELDHRAPSLREAATPLAQALFREGKIALDAARSLGRASHDGGAEDPPTASGPESEAWEETYRLFSAALRVDPSLSWARRYAEEARSHRLAALRSGS